MLVVVLGAGASFDSVNPRYIVDSNPNQLTWRPPLASELFQPRPGSLGPSMAHFDEAHPVFMRLATAIDSGEQVEDAIQRIEEDVQGTERGQRQLAALRFYLQEVLWQASDNWAAAAFGLTNYEQLVDDIERWRSVTDERVVYVTFNYDLLLERALRRVVDTTTFAGYVSGKTWLLKAHGSVNWGRSFAQPSNTQNGDHRIRLIDRAPEHVPTASGWGFFRGFDLSQPGDRASISATWMYPALAMPTRTKGGFVMPPEHEGFIARAVQDMDRLMVIGWRGQEQHFLDLLKASPRPVQGVVVTSKPESAASLVEHLGLHIRGLSAEALGTGPRRKRLCARRRSTVTDPRLLVGHMPMLLRSGHRVALARPDRGGATSGDG